MNSLKFSPDHIRTLAYWSEKLGLTNYRISLFTLYDRMIYSKEVSDEEITSSAMSALLVIRDTEKDKEMFYRTMNAWGI